MMNIIEKFIVPCVLRAFYIFLANSSNSTAFQVSTFHDHYEQFNAACECTSDNRTYCMVMHTV